jgi:hypothetical protein
MPYEIRLNDAETLRLLTFADVRQRIPNPPANNTFRRWMQKGMFPQGHKLVDGQRKKSHLLWREEDIDAWIAEQRVGYEKGCRGGSAA